MIELPRDVAQAVRNVGLIQHDLRRLDRHVLMNAPVAERSEEPELVLHERTAGRHVDVRDEIGRVAVGAEPVLLQIRIVIVAGLQRVSRPCERRAAVPPVAAGLRDHVQEHARRRHGDVVRAGRDLDVVERVEVVVEAGGADGRRIADIDPVQKRRVLRARGPPRAERSLESARCAADVRAADHKTGYFCFDERPDVAAARRTLNQLLAQVDVHVGARRIHGGR